MGEREENGKRERERKQETQSASWSLGSSVIHL